MERKNNTLIVTLLCVIIGILVISCSLLIFGIIKQNNDANSEPSFNSTQQNSSEQTSNNSSTPSNDNSSVPDNTSSETQSGTSSGSQSNVSSDPKELLTAQNVLEKINGVWGYRSYVIYVDAEKSEYLQAMYATSGGFSGKIMKVKEKGVNIFELQVFVKGHPADEMQEETQDETKFIIFKVDPEKKIITLNGSEYQYITDDFADDEAISKFFFGDVEE